MFESPSKKNLCQILDDGAHLARLNKQIAELRQELARANAAAASTASAEKEEAATAAELAQLREAEEKRIQMLQTLQNQVHVGGEMRAGHWNFEE